MKLFMQKNQTKTRTFDNYKMHMKKMLKIWIQNGLHSVYSLWRLDHSDVIPVSDTYVDTIDGEASQEQAVNAYKKVK